MLISCLNPFIDFPFIQIKFRLDKVLYYLANSVLSYIYSFSSHCSSFIHLLPHKININYKALESISKPSRWS